MGCGKSGSEEEGDSKLASSVSVAHCRLNILVAFLLL